VPRGEQTAAATLAQKALAAGLPGEQVDGNDVIAVHEAVARALARARADEGGTLIEALTYRLADHTTADDARRYREDSEVRPHWREEPVWRLRAYLAQIGAWGRTEEEALLAEARQQVEAAAAAYLESKPEPLSAIFDFTYAEPPLELRQQRAGALAEAGDA